MPGKYTPSKVCGHPRVRRACCDGAGCCVDGLRSYPFWHRDDAGCAQRSQICSCVLHAINENNTVHIAPLQQYARSMLVCALEQFLLAVYMCVSMYFYI